MSAQLKTTVVGAGESPTSVNVPPFPLIKSLTIFTNKDFSTPYSYLTGIQVGNSAVMASKTDYSETLLLDDDEYINKIRWELGRDNVWQINAIMHVWFQTNKGKTLGWVSDNLDIDTNTLEGRVIGLGYVGSSGVENLRIQFFDGWESHWDSSPAGSANFILHMEPPGSKWTEYTLTTQAQAKTWERAAESVLSQGVTASIEAEFFVKVSAEVSIQATQTDKSTVTSAIESKLDKSTTSELSIPVDSVGLLIVTGQIMKAPGSQSQAGYGPKYWMYPLTNAGYVVIPLTDSHSLLGHYDLTGRVADQMTNVITTQEYGWTKITDASSAPPAPPAFSPGYPADGTV